MNKVLKISGVILGIFILWQIGKCVYGIVCMSCTTSPITTYNYSGSMDQLEDGFKNFSIANPAIKCEISHRGPMPIHARDINIKMKLDDSDILCELVIYDFNNNTKLDIQYIYDLTHKKGGGSNADGKNVNELLNKFEENYLTKFQKDENIKLKKQFFNFF